MAQQWPPKRATAFTWVFPIRDSSGAPVTGVAGLDSEISKDGGAFADCTNEATEIGSTGFYSLLFTTTEMTADYVTVQVKSTSYPAVGVFILTAESTWDEGVDAKAVLTGGITTASFAAGAIDAAAIATDAIGAAELADGAITAATFAAGAIDAAAIATDAIGAAELADGAITAATFAAGALDAAALAADAGTEIGTAVWATATRVLTANTNLNDLSASGVRTAVGLASANLDTQLDALPTNAELATALGTADDATLAAIAALNNVTAAAVADAVWDEDATPHQSAGTFGLAIGDPAASTETLYKAIVTDPAGTNIAADVIAIKAETASILDDTDDIGVAGAGLSAIPWNASWDAEVQSEVADALEATIADSIPADGTIPSVKQALYMLTQFMLERDVAGTTVTVKKADGSTSLFTLTLNSSTAPTNITRAS